MQQEEYSPYDETLQITDTGKERRNNTLLPYVSIETHNFSVVHLEKLDALVEHIQKFMIENNFDSVVDDGNSENVKLDVFSNFVEEVKPINHQVNQEIHKLRESQEWTLENKTHKRWDGNLPSMRIHTFEKKLENPNTAKNYFNTFGPLIFKPGEVLSDRLAYALDMDSGEDVPPYVENMKKIGYPISYQGYSGKCFVESFDLKFDEKVAQQQEEKTSLCIPPDRKYIGYFGLNIAPPYEADTHRKWVYYDKSNDPSLIGRFTKHSSTNHHGKFLSYISLRGHFPTYRHNFDAPFGGFINDDYNENDIIMSD